MKSLVIRVRNQETGDIKTHSFQRSPVRIGRNELNDLSLPYSFVSGWHGIVRFDHREATYYDLGSTNGTVLQGRKLSTGEALSLNPDILLQIGQLELNFGREEQATIAPDPRQYLEPASNPASSPVYHPPNPDAASMDRNSPLRNSPPSRLRPEAVQNPAKFASASIDTDDAIPRKKTASQESSAGATSFLNLSRIHATIRELREHYSRIQPEIESWTRAKERSLQSLSESEREAASAMIAREFPLSLGSSSCSPSGPSLSPSTQNSLVHMAQAIYPPDSQPLSSEDWQQFAQRSCEVLDAFAKTFVELQRGQEQFGREMGVRAIKEFTPLHAAGDAKGVLQYLLDWHEQDHNRVHELVGTFADLMIHQVALINGMMEGVRGMLESLSPEQIENQVTATWPLRSANLWRAFTQTYEAMTEDDRKISDAIFGPGFVRAYSEYGGQRNND